MRLRIRGKLISSFLAVIISFVVIVTALAVYNHRALYRTLERVDAVTAEMRLSYRLSETMTHILMSANDYIITGKREYLVEFKQQAKYLDSLFSDAYAMLFNLETQGVEGVRDEMKLLDATENSWKQIKRLSQEIFAIPDPVGSPKAALLMEDMDYSWGKPAKEMIMEWHEFDLWEMNEAVKLAEKFSHRSWKILGAIAAMLMGIGIYLSFFLSKKLLSPVLELQRGSEAIASGSLDHRIEIDTGDEFEQLGEAFNNMAEKLQETIMSLGESEERTREIIDTAPNAILLVDASTSKIVAANLKAEVLTGYTRPELFQLELGELHQEGTQDKYREAFERTIIENRVNMPDSLVLRKDGTVVPVDIEASALKYMEKTFVLSFLLDITDRKEVEKVRADYTVKLEREVEERTSELQSSVEALKDSRRTAMNLLEDVAKSKKEWEYTFDNITDPIYVHDSEYRLIKCNRAYRELAGKEFKDIMGMPYYEVFPISDGPLEICKNSVESHAGKMETEEVVVNATDRVYKVNTYPVFDKDGAYIYSVHIMEDITEEKRFADKIAREQEITQYLLAIAKVTATTTNMNGLFKEVVEAIKSITMDDFVLAYTWDPKAGKLKPAHGAGLSSGQAPMFRADVIDGKARLVAKAFESGCPVVEKFSSEPGFLGWLDEADTMSLIPLTGRTGFLGLLVCIYKESNPKAAAGVTGRDLELMRGISHQVSISLEEARLYKEALDNALELSRKVETIETMHEIDTSILSTLDPGEVLDMAAMMINRLISNDRTTIALVDNERGGFVYDAVFGIDSIKKGDFIPFGETNATEVLKTGRPQFVVHLVESEDMLLTEKKLFKEGFFSHIRVPLRVKGEAIGVLTVGSRRRAAFTPEDLSSLEKLSVQISVALENSRLVEDFQALMIGTIRALSETIDAKSSWTKGHSDRVTKVSLEIGRAMRLDEEELKNLELAGLLHDIGKIATYESILDKRGSLTDEEFNEVKKHPGRGADILGSITQLKQILPVIKYHHEFYNGSGYPEGLKGDEIPLLARILTVADTIDAMGSDRPYRKGLPMEVICAELRKCAGTQFDPDVVGVFLNSLVNVA